MNMIRYMNRIYVIYATRMVQDEDGDIVVQFYIYYIPKDGENFWTWIDAEDCAAYRR